MKLGTKLSGGYLSATALIVVGIIVGYIGIQTANSNLTRIYKDNLLPVQYLSNANDAFLRIQILTYKSITVPEEADTTNQSIRDDIQKATNLAVIATEDGNKGVSTGSELVTRAAESIEELARAVEISSVAAQQIVAGVEQQTIGLDQIAVGMNDINQAAQQSAAGAEQSQKAAQDLTKLAEQLSLTGAHYRM